VKKNNAKPAIPCKIRTFGFSVIILYGHSCASLLLANGVSMKEIQEWLGHSHFSTTANIYAHLDYSSKISSAQVMSNSLKFLTI